MQAVLPVNKIQYNSFPWRGKKRVCRERGGGGVWVVGGQPTDR